MKKYIREAIAKKNSLIAGILLVIMATLSLTSAANESPIMDELPHVSSGYSYVKYQDYRLNPEHPPLIKMLSGLPLLLTQPEFPLESSAWTTEINSQWIIGDHFFYKVGNNPDEIIQLARLPMIIVLMVLGVYIFIWTKKEYGPRAALIALTLFAFSPNFIAHGRYVTTDIAATLGIVMGLFHFSAFLKKPTMKNAIISGAALGVAMLLKFSVFILYPFIAGALIILVVCNKKSLFHFIFTSQKFWKRVGNAALALVTITGISLFVVWALYIVASIGTPQAVGEKTIIEVMKTQIMGEGLVTQIVMAAQGMLLWMNEIPIFRPLAHFFLGIFMVIFRVSGGNNSFLIGEVTRQSWWYFYPIAFLIKTPIPTLFLFGSSIGLAAFKLPHFLKKRSLHDFIMRHSGMILLGAFAVFFFLISVFGNLNIGIRHIFPVYPAVYMFIGVMMAHALTHATQKNKARLQKILIVVFIYLVIEAVRIYPYYLAYFNNFIGSPNNAYKYLIDSNLDWGQDLKRLDVYMEKHNIEKIHINYFGGGSVEHQLGEKAEYFNPNEASELPRGWIALSATPYQTEFNGIKTNPEILQELRKREPDAQIGHSILLYYNEK
jgi:4-amino-4-deoxy-L-arabinose transferase-like glycosyltransferase